MSAAAAEKKPRENDRDTEKEREKEWGEKECKEAAAILEGVFRREPLSLKCFVASRGIYLYEAVVVAPAMCLWLHPTWLLLYLLYLLHIRKFV